jgi:menaquinone-dependent protoporphyrinogen oxidase
MASKVLVAYSSKYGATAEIAEKIGEVLQKEGLSADVLPMKKVKDLADYKDVILGSAMYIGMWRSEGAKFLKKNEATLAKQRVWVFSTGPSGKGDPVELLKGVVVPPNIQSVIQRIQPRETVVFHGYLNEQKMSFLEKWVVKRVGGGFGDFRDWDMITKWATKVAAAVKK